MKLHQISKEIKETVEVSAKKLENDTKASESIKGFTQSLLKYSKKLSEAFQNNNEVPLVLSENKETQTILFSGSLELNTKRTTSKRKNSQKDSENSLEDEQIDKENSEKNKMSSERGESPLGKMSGFKMNRFSPLKGDSSEDSSPQYLDRDEMSADLRQMLDDRQQRANWANENQEQLSLEESSSFSSSNDSSEHHEKKSTRKFEKRRNQELNLVEVRVRNVSSQESEKEKDNLRKMNRIPQKREPFPSEKFERTSFKKTKRF